jgi:hypothetical protein
MSSAMLNFDARSLKGIYLCLLWLSILESLLQHGLFCLSVGRTNCTGLTFHPFGHVYSREHCRKRCVFRHTQHKVKCVVLTSHHVIRTIVAEEPTRAEGYFPLSSQPMLNPLSSRSTLTVKFLS